MYKNSLKEKRNCIIVDDVCVSDKSDEIVKFLAVRDFQCVSGMQSDAFKDSWSGVRKQHGETYDVKTISLNDLLDKNNAPEYIEFLSIDTEGSEYEILKDFNFTKYSVSIFTIEHNYIDSQREKIKELLESNNYERIFVDHSKWDDWYISSEMKSKLWREE
jgi:FkbM family methyltransferase